MLPPPPELLSVVDPNLMRLNSLPDGRSHPKRQKSVEMIDLTSADANDAAKSPLVIDLTENLTVDHSEEDPNSTRLAPQPPSPTHPDQETVTKVLLPDLQLRPTTPYHVPQQTTPIFIEPPRRIFLNGPKFTQTPPWVPLDTDPASPLPLHDEILRFVSYISPTPAERAMRADVTQRITAVVNEIWPTATVEIFGSCATDLFLPTSDIDLVVCGAKSVQPPIYVLASAIRARRIARSLDCIGNARVPIVKMVDAATGCAVDISFDLPTGPANTGIMKKFLDESPLIRPLALVMKYYLAQLGLNEPYTGGIGSYTLLIMIISFLQLHQRRPSANTTSSESKTGENEAKTKEDSDLGDLLIRFFKLYGLDFNYAVTGISIRNGGSYFKKADRKPHPWLDPTRPWMLSCEDPAVPENDVSKSSFAILDVRDAFANAFYALSAPVPQDSGKGRGRRSHHHYIPPTLLCRILLKDWRTEDHRKMIQRVYGEQNRSNVPNVWNGNGGWKKINEVQALPKPHPQQHHAEKERREGRKAFERKRQREEWW